MLELRSFLGVLPHTFLKCPSRLLALGCLSSYYFFLFYGKHTLGRVTFRLRLKKKSPCLLQLSLSKLLWQPCAFLTRFGEYPVCHWNYLNCTERKEGLFPSEFHILCRWSFSCSINNALFFWPSPPPAHSLTFYNFLDMDNSAFLWKAMTDFLQLYKQELAGDFKRIR